MKMQPISLAFVTRVYWRGEVPPPDVFHMEHRLCALCGWDLSQTATVYPEGTHPCPPCGGWHNLHNACVDKADLVRRGDDPHLRHYGPLEVCPDALRVALEMMGQEPHA